MSRDGIQGFVCVPIRARDRILGTLSLGRRTPDPFTDEEVALLESAAGQIGLALDNARLYGETRQQLEDLRRAQSELVRPNGSRPWERWPAASLTRSTTLS